MQEQNGQRKQREGNPKNQKEILEIKKNIVTEMKNGFDWNLMVMAEEGISEP